MEHLIDYGAPKRTRSTAVPIDVLEILPVDAVMALLSAAILSNPRVLPARG